MQKKLILSYLFAVSTSAGIVSGANILVDSFTDTNANTNNFAYNGLGWHSKTFWQDGPTADSLQARQNFGTDGVNTFGIAQTVSVASLGIDATDLTLSFDWTPDATATQAVSLELTYQLVAWDTGGVAPDAADPMFYGMNFNGTTIGGGVNSPMPTGTIGFDLISGTFSDPVTVSGGSLFEHPSTGQLFPNGPVVSSAAGVTTSFSQSFSLDLGSNSVLSDYDYVGVRFFIGDGTANATDPGNDGDALISNISLDAVAVPEPSAALLSLCALSLFLRRRR
ncbi:MAG: hypothetical protein ACSHYB_05950 [Roseibacillus sp.]